MLYDRAAKMKAQSCNTKEIEMALHEYEWALYEMVGSDPSENDTWNAGGTTQIQEDAEREAMHYLSQYANDETGFRFEVFEVTRKSLGGIVRGIGA